MAYGQRNSILRLLPRKEGHLRVRSEHCRFFCHGKGMRLGVIRHDKDRSFAPAYEITRHAEHEVIILVVHFPEESRARFHRDVGSLLAQRGRPVLHVVPVEEVRHFRPKAAWHGGHGSDDALGRPLQHFPDEGTADAKTEDQKLADPQMIHQSELVVGIRIPWPVDLHWTVGTSTVGVPQIHRDASVLVAEDSHRVEGRFFRKIADCRIQSAAGNNQQRKAGASLVVVNLKGASFVVWHGRCSLVGPVMHQVQHEW